MNKISILLTIMARIFFLAVWDRSAWAGLTSYSHLVQTKAFDQLVEVDYGNQIYYNESLDIPTISVCQQFTNMEKAKSTIIKGYDLVIHKNVLDLGGSGFTSQASGNTTLTITLAANDKDHLYVGTLIRFKFRPTEANYTNFCIVTSKEEADTTTIVIRPHDYETNTAGKIGIASGIDVEAGTKMVLMGNRSARGAGSVKGTAMFPSVIDNEFQDMRTPYEVDDLSATEKMYVPGTPENLIAIQAKAVHNKRREASWLFNGSSWVRTIAAGTDTTQNSNMKGLWTAIDSGTSPAKKGYDTFSDTVLDEWMQLLNNSRLDDKSKKRFVLCNQALINIVSKWKRDAHHGIDLMETNAYGIPGVTRLKWGAITLDLHNHYLFDEIWPDQTKPMAMAIYFPFLRYKYKMKDHIRMNIQANDETKKKHEYRIVESYIAHQINTAYWGLLYANDERF